MINKLLEKKIPTNGYCSFNLTTLLSLKYLFMRLIFLDVVETPWIEEHGRDIIILSIMSIVAIVAVIGIFIWRKKRKTAK